MKKILTIGACLCSVLVWAQTVDYRLPSRYVDVLIPKEYQKVVDYTLAYLNTRGTIESLNNGIIHFQTNGEQYDLGLDNVVRKCANQTDRSLWRAIVERHFDNYFLLEQNISKLSMEVFDSVKNNLCVRFYPINNSKQFGAEWQNSMVTRCDLPNVYSVLMLDVAGGFVSIDQQQIALWQQNSDTLFRIALDNMQQHSPKIVYTQWTNSQPYFQFAETNYAAVAALNLPYFIPDQVGKYGTVFAIPTKGLLMGYPINDPESFKHFIRYVYPAVTYFHADQPGAITTDFYWYYDQKFEKIQLKALPDQDTFSVETPEKLLEIWKK